MARRKPRRAPPPLDESKLNELALRYVGRFATTRAKLRSYLARKVRERGWDGQREPDLGRIADRFAEQGYVDDAAYALAKSRALTGRGYGKRRVIESCARGRCEEDGARRATMPTRKPSRRRCASPSGAASGPSRQPLRDPKTERRHWRR